MPYAVLEQKLRMVNEQDFGFVFEQQKDFF